MMNKEPVFVSAVVYFRDGTKEEIEAIQKIGTVLEDSFSNYEVIIADDSGKSKAKELLRDMAAAFSGSFSVVAMSYPQGVQQAMNAGIDLAIGDFVFEFECAAMDFEPSLILTVFHKALEGYDIVAAVPEGAERATSKWFYRLFNRYSNSLYPLLPERFRLVSRRAINRIESMSDSIVYRKAFYRNSGLKCDSVCYRPINDALRTALPKERSKLATDSLILFTTVSQKLSMLMTIVMMLATIFSFIYAAVIFLLGKPTEGWTTIMLFVSFSFCGVFLILTLLIKYLSILIELTFKKSRYVFENISRLN